MTLHLKMPSKVNNLSPKISVIGVGGAGGNIINSMIESKISGVSFLNVNTDSQQLKHSLVEQTLQLGPNCTQGLGAGANPEVGKAAAEEVVTEIQEYLEDANMVFLTAGMGGGTGTGASPVVARVARDMGILIVGVVTKPFTMEGKLKMEQANEGIRELQKYVDNLIVIPNQNIFHSAKPETTFTEAFQLANNVLINGVRSIIDVPGSKHSVIAQKLSNNIQSTLANIDKEEIAKKSEDAKKVFENGKRQLLAPYLKEYHSDIAEKRMKRESDAVERFLVKLGSDKDDPTMRPRFTGASHSPVPRTSYSEIDTRAETTDPLSQSQPTRRG